ncbi:MAG: TonB-dependent receptor plug domain-containing protein [Sulfurimonas sp.]|nr:TonB-dependent receptor plug domain-containing protein [Sulfurimonas sp.]
MQNAIKLSLISVALLSQLQANQEITLSPIAITSTAIVTDELKSTDAVEVYTEEDIKKAHVQNVYEFLNKATSVFATSAYGNPFLQKIDMRGYGVGDGYQNIVVTINGRKMNNVDMVPQLLSSISPSSIKKIEIIKSSGIVVAGDGANAGVINIVTKQSNDKEISFYMGTYGLFDGSFYAGHKGEKLSINASGEAQRMDGIRNIDASGEKQDANSFATGSFNLAYTPSDELELRLGAIATKTDVIYAGPISEAQYKDNPTTSGTYSVHQKYDSNVLSAGATYYVNDSLSFNVDASKENKKSQYLGAFPFSAFYDYRSINATLDYITKRFAIKAGIDSFDGDVDAKSIALTKSNKASIS